MNPARDRGVFDSDHRGVSVVFAPLEELGRITERLTGEGIEVLGVGTSLSKNGYNVAALVRSTDKPTLEAIVNPGA